MNQSAKPMASGKDKNQWKNVQRSKSWCDPQKKKLAELEILNETQHFQTLYVTTWPLRWPSG